MSLGNWGKLFFYPAFNAFDRAERKLPGLSAK